MTTLAINKQNFEAMVQAQPQLATKLITLLSERIWLAYRQLANLLITDPVGRMYDTLLTQVQKKKVAIQPKTSYVFDIGSQEILKMLGYPADRGEEYLITMLSDKNLRLDQGKFICKDLAELEKQVQFIRKRAAAERQREAAKMG